MLTFTLTDQQADVVLNALAQRPFFEVQGVIQVMQSQAQPQLKAQQAQQQAQTTGQIQQAGLEKIVAIPDAAIAAQVAQNAPQGLNGAAPVAEERPVLR